MAVTGMTQMSEAQTEIEKMYQQYLGRAPDQGGLDYYTNLASSGRSLDGIRQSIAGSPEAQAYTPPAQSSAVQSGLLSSPPSPPVAQSPDTMQMASTAPSMPQPANTAPAVTEADINALYQQYLGRDAKQGGLDYWMGDIANGSSLDEVAYNIQQSQEYQQAQTSSRPPPEVGEPQPEFTLPEATSLITGLYQSILGRAPEQAGLDYWVDSLMNTQANLEDIRYNMHKSGEFGGRARNEIGNYYAQLTGESGDPSQVTSYVGEAVAQAKTLDQIYQEIYNSDAAIAFRASQNNAGQPSSGNVGTGSQGSVQNAVRDTQSYDATQAAGSADASAEDAQVVMREVSPDELVENRIANLLDGDNPYIERARTSGLQFANQRGLLNSSIAAQASEEAAIARAGEIAAQDAATYSNAALANQQAQNSAGLQNAQLGTNVSMFNVGEDNTTNRFNAQSVNEAGQFKAAAANQAMQNFLQREQVRLLQDDQQAFTAEQNEADRVLRETLQNSQFDFTSNENSLDRNLQNALQENQFAFQSDENSLQRDFQSIESALDRSLTQALQDQQFEFTGTQNDLDRILQTALQESQFAFTGDQNALDRSLQAALQSSQQSFAFGQNALDRAQQTLMADKEIAFREWAQSNEQSWKTAQNELQLEFQYYNSNAQTATSIMYSTMEGVAQIYADPNLTASQKQSAIANLLNSANSMPQLLSTIQANVTAVQETNAATNYDESGVWIGTGYPNWVTPPAIGTTVTPGDFAITNPNTGQTFIAPNNGYVYSGQTTAEGGGNGSATEDASGNFTGDPSTLENLGAGTDYASNLYQDPATNKIYQLVGGVYIPFRTNGFGPFPNIGG